MTEEPCSITQVSSKCIQEQQSQALTIGQLERALLSYFPREDAESWDRTGLMCGDPFSQVSGVAIALDATLEAIETAKRLGANVVLTHHPVFLDAPQNYLCAKQVSSGQGRIVYEAIKNDIALMNYHTSLDVSPHVAPLLPSMLNLELNGVFDILPGHNNKGYGQICTPKQTDKPLMLSTLAARSTAVFGRLPRVWGSPDNVLETIVTATGSASDLAAHCVERSYSCLVCGEIRYHSALDAAHAGLSIIELGHDVSELPLCAVLAKATREVGLPETAIHILDQGHNWWTPEAIRR